MRLSRMDRPLMMGPVLMGPERCRPRDSTAGLVNARTRGPVRRVLIGLRRHGTTRLSGPRADPRFDATEAAENLVEFAVHVVMGIRRCRPMRHHRWGSGASGWQRTPIHRRRCLTRSIGLARRPRIGGGPSPLGTTTVETAVARSASGLSGTGGRAGVRPAPTSLPVSAVFPVSAVIRRRIVIRSACSAGLRVGRRRHEQRRSIEPATDRFANCGAVVDDRGVGDRRANEACPDRQRHHPDHRRTGHRPQSRITAHRYASRYHAGCASGDRPRTIPPDSSPPPAYRIHNVQSPPPAP